MATHSRSKDIPTNNTRSFSPVPAFPYANRGYLGLGTSGKMQGWK
jgi:hypothetical protein